MKSIQHLHNRKPIFVLLFSSLILIGVVLWHTLLSPTASDSQNANLLTVDAISHESIQPLQARLEANPDDAQTYAQLGLILAQDARLYDDITLYNLAEEAFLEALVREPENVDALMGMGIVELTRHDFPTALKWAKQAREINPFRSQILGIMVDANVEMGRYDEAVQLAQEMVDLRPDIHSYTRISYLREIHGEAQGAIDAMQMAVDVGLPGSEPWLWAQTHLGNLHFERGDLVQATSAYEQALQLNADYFHAQAGLADVQAAQGEYNAAIAHYEAIVQVAPLSGFLLTLGELYDVTGQSGKAQEQYDLAGEIELENMEAGVDVELELAVYKSEYTDELTAALEHAQNVYADRPSIFSADTLAWVLYRNGEYEEAWHYVQEALRFGIHEAPFHYHAGMIAHALGNETEAAMHLARALEINPYFSITDASTAQEVLTSLDSSLSWQAD